MAGGVVCGRCQRRPPAYAATHAAAAYAWPLDSLIHACKYRQQLWLFDGLAMVLDAAVPAVTHVDALLPMPLDPARLAERGYNQAYELARRLARRRGLPVLSCQVRRRRNSAHQADLPLRQRIRNMRGAFSVRQPLPARIAIVDDVMTSGASVAELAQTLRRAGVSHVEVWILARTLPQARR